MNEKKEGKLLASLIQLITRGDDLGSSRSANAGILEACRKGILKNVSVMACAPYVEEAAELFSHVQGVCFGLHATFNAEWDNLRWGPVLPALQVPSLVDNEGLFFRTTVLLERNQPSADEMLAELQAQLEKLRNLGFDIRYADTHMGFEWVHPDFRELFGVWCSREGLVNGLIGHRDLPKTDIDFLGDPIDNVIKRLEAAKTERSGRYVMVGHPAYEDDEMRTLGHDGYPGERVAAEREWERRMFMDAAVIDYCSRSGIVPVRYDEAAIPVTAKYIWTDPEGQGRDRYARFRMTFRLEGKPVKALFHLFADTTYQLFVNGQFVQFGPLRFDPQYPKYDTHDVSGYLRDGMNVIAVQVNYCGHKTFITKLSQAGMITWGEVVTELGERIILDSGGGTNWRSAPVPAYRYAPKASLFLRASEVYDQRIDEDYGWKDISFDDTHWPEAAVLTNQNAWGSLEKRNVPYMSGERVAISDVMAVLPLQQREDWYSFDVPFPFVKEIHMPDRDSPFLAFKTWIYSPEDRVVTAGVYYQDTWINGKKVESSHVSRVSSMRMNQRWALNKGWNYYFGCVNVYQDIFHHYLALPADLRLIVSANRDPSSPAVFCRTPVVSLETYEARVNKKTLPFDSEDPLQETGGWIDVMRDEHGQSPCRESSWDHYGEEFETIRPERLEGHVFSLSAYPNGFALLLDIGMTKLVLPRIVMENASGGMIDLTFSEHLMQDGLHLKHTHWYGLGDRAIASGEHEELDWQLSQPRGFRYMKLTVRRMKSDVRLSKLELKSASYPVVLQGSFQSSDPLLGGIWQLGARTQAANMEDGYVDCVTRERGQYIRDTIIQYHNNLVLFGDHELMYRCLELVGQSADPTGKFRAVYPNDGDYTIADFALNAVEGFWAYYEHTGDARLLVRYWEAIQRNLAWFHELADEQDGLLLDSEWHIKRGINAHYGGFHGDLGIVDGYMDNTGLHCVFSCTYLIALRAAASIARVIGRNVEQSALEERITILEASIRSAFWNEELGCYSDNERKTTHAIHASLFAVRAGAASKEQIKSIRQYVKREFQNLFVNGCGPEDGVYVSPSFSFYIFDGLYRLGLPETAEHMMKQGWGWFLQQGLRQAPEYFNLDNSLCHAWSACPTYFLSKYILGVQLSSVPDLDEVRICVQTATVTGAEGAVPHRRGLIEVKWRLDESGQRVFDYIRAPEGVTVKLME